MALNVFPAQFAQFAIESPATEYDEWTVKVGVAKAIRVDDIASV